MFMAFVSNEINENDFSSEDLSSLKNRICLAALEKLSLDFHLHHVLGHPLDDKSTLLNAVGYPSKNIAKWIPR